MKTLSKIWFPAAAVAFTAATMSVSHPGSSTMMSISAAQDTVVYKHDSYKTPGARTAEISDSLLKLGAAELEEDMERKD